MEKEKKKWKHWRDEKFCQVHSILHQLEEEDKGKRSWSNEQWKSFFLDVMSETKKILGTVDCQDLPWSAVQNTLCGHFREIGWDFERERTIRMQREPSPEDIEHHIQKACAFVLHWTPKSSDSYVSRYAGQSYPPRGESDEMDLKEFVVHPEDRFPEKDLLRVLPSNFPRRKYESLRQGMHKDERAGRHWGQRKLLMNEIELLNMHAGEGFTVLYAGAAPCTHLAIIEDMFQILKLKYVLVDPAPFHVRRSPNIEIRSGSRGLFSNTVAKEFSPIGDKLLFISDIRREHDSEQQILQDMEDQMHWHITMSPRASMFKFRLPWCPGKTPYLTGKVYIQPYAHMHSTETRLISTTSDIVEWDNVEYEEHCFYFNTKTRLQEYDHGVKGAGLYPDYDCAAEVMILRQYFRRFDSQWASRSVNEQNALVSSLSVMISKRLGGRRGREYLDRGRLDDLRDLGYHACDTRPIESFLSALSSKSQTAESSRKRKAYVEPQEGEESRSAKKGRDKECDLSSYPREVSTHPDVQVRWSESKKREYFYNTVTKKSAWNLSSFDNTKA